MTLTGMPRRTQYQHWARHCIIPQTCQIARGQPSYGSNPFPSQSMQKKQRLRTSSSLPLYRTQINGEHRQLSCAASVELLSPLSLHITESMAEIVISVDRRSPTQQPDVSLDSPCEEHDWWPEGCRAACCSHMKCGVCAEY